MVRSFRRARISPALTWLPSSFNKSATTPSVCVGTSTWCSTESTVKISPVSPPFAGAAGAGEAGGGAAGALAGAAGAALGLEATEELPQPITPNASAPARTHHARLIIILASFFSGQPGPGLLPNPAERRPQQDVPDRIPPAVKESAPGANPRASHHAIAREPAAISEYGAHQKILVACIRSRLGSDSLDGSFKRFRREGVE